MLYSQTKKGFYSPSIHTSIPEDAVEITDEHYQALLSGQAEGKRIVAAENGNPVLVEPLPPTLEDIKIAMWERIKVERDRRQAGGVLFGGHWFKTDERSRADYLSIITLVQLAGRAPTDVIRPAWRTMTDGVTVDMTMALAGGIIAAGAQQWFLIDNAAQAHKTALEASSDPASYDFSSGWPEVFGD